ncbi:MAG: hypothetical protein RI954_363 [Actinomycetota bacterium]|jgi:hypothetical protein
MAHIFMDIFEEAQDLARNIRALHVSSGTAHAHCVLCDQPFPCTTAQTAMSIEAIVLPPMRVISGQTDVWNRERSVVEALQQISIALGAMIDHRNEQHLSVFEQLSALHGLTGIVQTGFVRTGSSTLTIGFIHPETAEVIRLWALDANLLHHTVEVTVWLDPTVTASTRPFLVDMLCAAMQPLDAMALLDGWRGSDVSTRGQVTQTLPIDGEVIAETVRTLVSATIELVDQAEPVWAWDNWADDPTD